MESLSSKYHEFGLRVAPKSKVGKRIYDFLDYFSLKERVFFYVLLLVFVVSFGLLVKKANDMVTVTVPLYGGTLKEGVVGIPRFSNPVLATSDVDKDVARLVYSGLMRVGPDGMLIPDLAEKYNVSKDGLVYTFNLKKNAKFQDGSKVTGEDIVYTVAQVKNPIFKSPRSAAWNNISVEAPDEKTVVFRLKTPYALFLENTTLGILPKKIWKNVTDDVFAYSDLNLSGVGSGPYQVTAVAKDKDGVPKSLVLKAFDDFASGRAYIKNINLHFYANEDALQAAYRAGSIDAISGISAVATQKLLTNEARVVPFVLPRVFAVFFNQNQVPAFTYREVRAALDGALDKEAVTRAVLTDYGTPISGPLPPGSFGHASSSGTKLTTEARMVFAKTLLQQNGWKIVNGIYEKRVSTDQKKKGVETIIPLSFSIATADTPELKQAAEIIRDTWNRLGARVEVKIYEVGDLNQNVIRPRSFDALFFGEIIGRNPDPYFFWHSSQRLDPGLNIAMYTNPAVDKLVEDIRFSKASIDRFAKLQSLDRVIQKDVPASFIYAPQYIYLISNKIRGVAPSPLTTPDERFSMSHTWYIETERVWKLFK